MKTKALLSMLAMTFVMAPLFAQGDPQPVTFTAQQDH